MMVITVGVAAHPVNPGYKYNINDVSSKIFEKVISCSAKSFRLCKSIREKRCIFTPIKRNLYYLLSNSMEDFILREIDRLGEMLLIIARKLGLQEDVMPDYTLLDVKDEFEKAVCPINLDALLEQENPVWYLVETEKISDHGLETFIEILFHSDLDEDRKAAILHDALAYLDGKGFFSFKLHALSNS